MYSMHDSHNGASFSLPSQPEATNQMANDELNSMSVELS